MSDYTPITNRIRKAWITYRIRKSLHTAPEANQEFDRWLNSVKAEAWDECLESLRAELEHELQYVDIRNPYREASNE